MTDFSLAQHGILRPEKIRWIFPSEHSDPLLEIRSDSLRKFLQISIPLLEENGISFDYGSVSPAQYEKWYDFYTQNMEEREYNIIASKDLVQEKQSENKLVEGIFFYKNNEIIGGGIIIRKGLEFATLAYKASQRISLSNKKNSSFGAVIDYFFLVRMKELGIQSISGGRSRNAFGVLNSFGHLEYKLRLGYTPIIAENSPLSENIPINEKKCVAFLGIRNDKQELFLLKNKMARIDFDLFRFSTPKLPCVEIIEENL